MSSLKAIVVGAGLSGCEAAWSLAQKGVQVTLFEMKKKKRTPAQNLDFLAELVCSNSLRSNNPLNAIGLLKEEMQAFGSLIVAMAYEAKVPAGDALAVDRVKFGEFVTRAIREHKNIDFIDEEVLSLDDVLAKVNKNKIDFAIIATGPLTGDALAKSIQTRLADDGLYFFDALAPIVDGDTLNRDIIFEASRYDKGEGSDYLNIPLNKEEYEEFVDAILAAECMPFQSFESYTGEELLPEAKYFEGCLPIEVMAGRGRETLRFGCMKPVGLTDPRTGRWPHAVVQLRKEDVQGQNYNLVGFQTKMKHGQQKRILRSLPGMENVEFRRLGTIHRNTYINAPKYLDENMSLNTEGEVPLYFSGQMTGVEGYVESAAHGLLTAHLAFLAASQTQPVYPPVDCAFGALYAHVRGDLKIEGRGHEPQNINWGLFPPAPEGVKKKERKEAKLSRARSSFAVWKDKALSQVKNATQK